jgi:hypothetical protein
VRAGGRSPRTTPNHSACPTAPSPIQITTTRGTAHAVVEIDDRLQPGHAALPNCLGLDLPAEDGGTERTGVALNPLTDMSVSVVVGSGMGMPEPDALCGWSTG